jgi:aminocarboxymuconate-semialdehyde decarboxylase
MLDALKSRVGAFKNIELTHQGDAWKLAFASGPPTRPISPGLRDADKRRQWMQSNAIDCQVCGGWLDSFGYELPPDEGAAWSRFLNEHLATATNGHKHLGALATVPLQNGKLAAQVLREAMKAGFPGAMIGTQPKGSSGNLDDPDLDPFWEAASELKATLYLHPMFGCGDARLNDYDMINAVGRGVDTTTAISRLLFSGHFLKYSGMTMVLSHGGGAIPYMMGRLERNCAIHPGEYASAADGFRRLYFDSVLFDPATLAFLVGKVGAGRVVLGSDYPFPIGDLAPCKIVRDAPLPEADRRLILGDTAKRLFRLEE